MDKKSSALNPTHPGLLITFEGGDGTGKTTQTTLLLAALQKLSLPAQTVHAISGTQIGEQIRHILTTPENTALTDLAEAFLFQAARAQLYQEKIRPGLQAGQIFLMDRSSDSSLVYQGLARGLGLDLITRLNLISTTGITPDITFILDAPAEIGLDRIRALRPTDRFENETLQFHQDIRQGYLTIAAQQKKSHYQLIDATAPIATIHQQVLTALTPFIPQLADQK